MTDRNTTTYDYYNMGEATDERGNHRLGLMKSAQTDGPVHSLTADAWGNKTDSYNNQTFVIIAGQAKMDTSTTWSHSESTDGSVTDSLPYTVKYTYNQDTEDNRARNIVGLLVKAESPPKTLTLPRGFPEGSRSNPPRSTPGATPRCRCPTKLSLSSPAKPRRKS